MSLTNPDSRRALRAVMEALVVAALLGLLYWLTGKLDGHPHELLDVARGCLVIIGIGTLFYGAENVTRAFKISGPAGLGAEFGAEPTSVKVVNEPDNPVPVETST